MTKVAECNKLETGVGPSMASGSHKNVEKTTDLKPSQIKRFHSAKLLWAKSAKFVIPENVKIATISPTRLNPIADPVPKFAKDREFQCPINLKLIQPIISHAKIMRKKPEDDVQNQTEKIKMKSFQENSAKSGSNSK